jgi:predicted kinase
VVAVPRPKTFERRWEQTITELILTVGLPGSGKTTWAKKLLDSAEPGTMARVNRDDLRAMLHNSAPHLDVTESQVTAVQHRTIRQLLSSGVSVIVDDTNLRDRVLRGLVKMGVDAGASIKIEDMTAVELSTCLARNMMRKTPVPKGVIETMHRKFVRGRGPRIVDDFLPPPAEAAGPYKPKPGTPKAILVDIDGTVALMGDRSPYDRSEKLLFDKPNWPVIHTVRAMRQAGYQVIFLSGRKEAGREHTETWLHMYLDFCFEGPYMRGDNDGREDYIFKREVFDTHVRDRYNVVAVFDDRKQVVDMWRSLGLTVMQVAEGNF